MMDTTFLFRHTWKGDTESVFCQPYLFFSFFNQKNKSSKVVPLAKIL